MPTGKPVLPIHLQEVVFSSSNAKFSKQISRLEKAAKLRKIAARIYSPNFIDSPEIIIRRNLFAILGKLYPGSISATGQRWSLNQLRQGIFFLPTLILKK